MLVGVGVCDPRPEGEFEAGELEVGIASGIGLRPCEIEIEVTINHEGGCADEVDLGSQIEGAVGYDVTST